MEKAYKTFYTVDCSFWGFDFAKTECFDDKQKAYAFAQQDYTGKPVAHVLKKKKSISYFNFMVFNTNIDLKISSILKKEKLKNKKNI